MTQTNNAPAKKTAGAAPAVFLAKLTSFYPRWPIPPATIDNYTEKLGKWKHVTPEQWGKVLDLLLERDDDHLPALSEILSALRLVLQESRADSAPRAVVHFDVDGYTYVLWCRYDADSGVWRILPRYRRQPDGSSVDAIPNLSNRDVAELYRYPRLSNIIFTPLNPYVAPTSPFEQPMQAARVRSLFEGIAERKAM